MAENLSTYTLVLSCTSQLQRYLSSQQYFSITKVLKACKLFSSDLTRSDLVPFFAVTHDNINIKCSIKHSLVLFHGKHFAYYVADYLNMKRNYSP